MPCGIIMSKCYYYSAWVESFIIIYNIKRIQNTLFIRSSIQVIYNIYSMYYVYVIGIGSILILPYIRLNGLDNENGFKRQDIFALDLTINFFPFI